MQIKLAQDIANSMNMMKYALNHRWKFEYPVMAILASTLQTLMNMTVVILNYEAILLSDNTMDIVMDFLALVVVSELDDYFYQTHGDSICKDIIQGREAKYSELLKI